MKIVLFNHLLAAINIIEVEGKPFLHDAGYYLLLEAEKVHILKDNHQCGERDGGRRKGDGSIVESHRNEALISALSNDIREIRRIVHIEEKQLYKIHGCGHHRAVIEVLAQNFLDLIEILDRNIPPCQMRHCC